MATLNVISEKDGEIIGSIDRSPDGRIVTSGLGQNILDQISHGKGWDADQTFDALADGGWSNGYVTVQSLAAA